MKRKLALLLLLFGLPFLIVAKDSSSISITGVDPLVAENIRLRLTELAEMHQLEAKTDEEIRLQIAKAMEPYGYFKADPALLNRHPLIIHVKPGPVTILTNITVKVMGEGTENPVMKQALHRFPLHSGQIFHSDEYEKAKRALLNAAEQQGYLKAAYEQAEIFIDTHKNHASISLLLQTGSQFYFGQVHFDPTVISPTLLQRYVPFKKGEPYSIDAMLKFNHELSTSGYFSTVSVNPILNQGYHVPTEVHLKPVPRYRYSFGLGYGTDTGIRGRLGYSVTPLNAQGHRFNAIALGSFNENTLQAQYLIPGTNPVADNFHFTGNLSNLSYDSGSSNALLVAAAQQHTTSQYQRTLSLNGLYERYHYFATPNITKKTLFPKASFVWKNTKDALFSPSGYSLSLEGIAASRALFSDVSFAQASVHLRAALTIEALRTRFYFHSIQGINSIGNIQQMPLSLAFLLGGAENLKGYSYNSIGPGKRLTFNGFEIQKETAHHWYLIGFADSGSVFNPEPLQWKRDVGGGIMWVSPIGPIKIGLAQGFDDHIAGKRRILKFIVNMGPDL